MWCPECNLLAWLHYNKVDQITDDEEFMLQEEVIKEYCEKRNFKISEEDIKTIRGRGLEESFENWKYIYIYGKRWRLENRRKQDNGGRRRRKGVGKLMKETCILAQYKSGNFVRIIEGVIPETIRIR